MFIEGEGAGGKATASSVISDIYEITKESNYKFFSTNLKNIECYDKNNLKRPYYLRLMVKDQPGVLSKITSILTNKNISIQTILQLTEEKINNIVPIVLTTYETFENNLSTAIIDINKENFLEDKLVKITIQN